MNPPECNEEDYINFLVATPKTCSGTEAARVQPEKNNPPSHDAFTRLLHRLDPLPDTLWQEAKSQLDLCSGILVFYDSTLDRPYCEKFELVIRHWSGKHHSVVRGINLMTLLWTYGDRHIPCDYRLFDKAKDGLSMNGHFQQVLVTAHGRGFRPKCVAFDSWYASLPNLKKIRPFNWIWLTRLKENRLVNPGRQGLVAISRVKIGKAE